MKPQDFHNFPPPWFTLEKYAAVKNFTAIDWLRQLKIRAELRNLLTDKDEKTNPHFFSPIQTDIANLCFEHGVITKQILEQGKAFGQDLLPISYPCIPRENALRSYSVMVLPENGLELYTIERQTLFFLRSKDGKKWKLVFKLSDKIEKATSNELEKVTGLIDLLNKHWELDPRIPIAERMHNDLLNNTFVSSGDPLKDKERYFFPQHTEETSRLEKEMLSLIEPYLLEKYGKNPWLYFYEPTAQSKSTFNSVCPVGLGTLLALVWQIDNPDVLAKKIHYGVEARLMSDSGAIKGDKEEVDEGYYDALRCANFPFDLYQQINPLQSLSGWRYLYGKSGYANIRVNLAASDEQIVEDFKKMLRWYRKNIIPALPLPQAEKNISQTTFSKWEKSYILPYIDLRIWAAMHHKTFRYHDYALAISSDIKDLSVADAFSDDAIRRTTHPMALSALSDSTIQILTMQIPAVKI